MTHPEQSADAALERVADLLMNRLDQRMKVNAKHSRQDAGSGSPELGAIVRYYRGTRSLREVGDAAGLHHGFVGRVERGERGISVESLAKLTRYFGPRFAIEYLNVVAGIADRHESRPEVASGEPEDQDRALDTYGNQGGYGDFTEFGDCAMPRSALGTT